MSEIGHRAARKEIKRQEKQRALQREQAVRIKQKLEQDEKAMKEAERNEGSAARALLKIQREKASRVDKEGSDWRDAMLKIRSGSPANVADVPNSADTEKEVAGPRDEDTSKEAVIPGLVFRAGDEQSIPALHLQSKETEAEVEVPWSDIAKEMMRQQDSHISWRSTQSKAELEVPLPRTIMEAVRQQELETKRERNAKKELKRLQKKGAWCPSHSHCREMHHPRRFGEVR